MRTHMRKYKYTKASEVAMRVQYNNTFRQIVGLERNYAIVSFQAYNSSNVYLKQY